MDVGTFDAQAKRDGRDGTQQLDDGHRGQERRRSSLAQGPEAAKGFPASRRSLASWRQRARTSPLGSRRLGCKRDCREDLKRVTGLSGRDTARRLSSGGTALVLARELTRSQARRDRTAPQ